MVPLWYNLEVPARAQVFINFNTTEAKILVWQNFKLKLVLDTPAEVENLNL